MNLKFTSSFLLIVFVLLFSTNTNAQLANGTTIPDWTFTDTEGNSHNLYTYLDQGMNVVLDMSATWCLPCWNYHNTQILENFYQAKGPNGTGEVMVFHIESAPNTSQQCIYGPAECNSTSLGDWTVGVTYPILNLNDADATWMNNNYNVNFFPTLYNICPDKRVWEVGHLQQSEWDNWIVSCSLEASGTVTANENCFGQNTGTINTSNTGGLGTPSFLWSNGSNSSNLSGVSEGTYSCTVTEAQGYFVELGPFTVTGPIAPLAISLINNNNLTCAGIPTGSISTSTSGGTPDYQYQWSNNSNEPNISDLPAGTYTLTVTDANDCIETQTYTISEPLPLALTATPTAATCDQENVIIVLNATGGTNGYIYDIGAGPSNSNQFLDLPPGIYTATVTDSNECIETTTITLSAIPAPIADAGPDANLDCTIPQVTLQGDNSSTGNNITITWTTTNGNIISGANTPTPIVDAAGLYIIHVNDVDSDCISSDSVLVSGNTTLPNASAGPNGTLNCSVNSITLDGTQSSIGSSFSYQWTTINGNIINGATTLNPTVDAAGIYSLIVNNSTNLCSATASVEITSNTAPPLASTFTSGNIDCNNAIVTIDGSASSSGNNFAYEWLDNENNSIGNLPIISAASPGTYTLIVTDTENGCTTNASVLITENIQVPIAVASVSNNLDCNNAIAILDAAGSTSGSNISYEWTDANENNIGNSSSIIVSNPGTYTLLVLDTENGCSSQSSISLSENSNPTTASVTVSGSLDCSNSAVTLDGTASTVGNNITYEWQDENGNSISTSNTTNVSIAGNYSLIVTNTQSGCTSIDSIAVTSNNTPPNANIASSDELTCTTNTVTLDGTGSSTGSNIAYEWFNENGNSIGTNNTLNVSNSGVYELIVTNTDNACTAISSTEVVSFTTPPNSDAGTEGTLNCTITSLILDGTNSSVGGNIKYEWTTINGNITSGTNTLNPTIDAPGIYRLTVTNTDNGCTSISEVIVEQIPSMDISLNNLTDVSCFGNSDGSASINVSGGAGNYTYNWSNGSTSETIENVPAGEYIVMVSDADNCTDTYIVNIEEPTELVGTIVEIVNVDCANSSDGTATVEGTGGTGTLTYLWSDGMNTPTVSNLSPGTYTVSITDENFCTNSVEITIEANDSELPIAMAQNITIPLSQNGEASIDVGMVSNGSSDNCGITNMVLDINQFDCDDLGENIVTLSVVDGAGNSNTTTAIITVIDDLAPIIETCPENIISNNCNGVTYALPTATDNCSTPTPMLVSGLASGEVFPEGVTEVVYKFSDQSGNEVLCSFTITVENDLNLGVGDIMHATDNQANGFIEISVNGGTMPYDFLWTSGGVTVSTSQNLIDIPSGLYNIQVTDANGCILLAENIIVDEMVADENVLLEKLIKINPNPTSGIIFVDVNLLQHSDVQLDIFDITGRSMITIPSQEIAQQLLELDLSKFTSGVYILKIKVDNKVLAKRLILQK